MRKLVSLARWLLTAIAIIIIGTLSTRHVFAAGVVGTGTPASCTQSALDNALQGGGLVTFNCGANPVTITLGFTEPIQASTTMDGANKITIKAPNLYHFQVYVNQTFLLKNIILTGGNSATAGSVENYGTFKTVNVTFFKNKGGNLGGAIYNEGTLNIKKSHFNNNRATNNGGAIYNEGGNVKIKSSSFQNNKTNNSGGAVVNDAGDLVIVSSTFTANTAADGGAVWTAVGSTNTISKSNFNGNHASSGAGIENFGGIQILLTTLSNNIAVNDGGGIWQAGSMSLEKSTVSGNQATTGAGMADYGDSTFVDQSTFSGNQASGNGGGIYSTTNTGIQNSTFSGNSAGAGFGGGALYESGASASFQYSTIANNHASFGAGVNADSGAPNSYIYFSSTVLSNNTGGNCAGSTISSNGRNLSSDNYCGAAFTSTGDRNNKNAMLGALANNGGPTLTHLPLPGSPLINKGYTDNHVQVDQRNLPRPAGGKSDIGSVEVQ